jgi:hypothetical protein
MSRTTTSTWTSRLSLRRICDSGRYGRLLTRTSPGDSVCAAAIRIRDAVVSAAANRTIQMGFPMACVGAFDTVVPTSLGVCLSRKLVSSFSRVQYYNCQAA